MRFVRVSAVIVGLVLGWAGLRGEPALVAGLEVAAHGLFR